ncbi:MAG TPA: type II toxin-antitoxin system prevent-host-death family antitoxin [Thermoanaerobaculia bacterium]|nr:type II toxin-antitoxin system prevent-host-death family antitoxin [Thermoanaerobaculia bacterium]
MTKTVAIEEVALREIVDELKADDEVVITRNGQPVAKVVPVSVTVRRHRSLEEMRGSVRFLGDILEPLDEEWDVEK